MIMWIRYINWWKSRLICLLFFENVFILDFIGICDLMLIGSWSNCVYGGGLLVERFVLGKIILGFWIVVLGVIEKRGYSFF